MEVVNLKANNPKIIENHALQETLYRYTVHPGMDVYILPKTGYQKKYAIFSTKFGSIDNLFQVAPDPEVVRVPNGVAHFLEHKLFEDERGNVFDRFAALGASPNAYTSFTQTTYLFSCTSNFEENLELLLDFVQEPYFTEKSVQKEQGIIGQEIKMYEDHPHWRVFFNLLAGLYCEHPVRNDIAGTLESISQITPDLLYRCYRAFYHPSNMAVFVVGDVSPKTISRKVQENLSRHNYNPMSKIERYFPHEPPEICRQRTEQTLVVSEPIINLGFKDTMVDKLQGRQLLRREILMEMVLEVLFGTSEPLYNTLYQEGLIDDRFEAGYSAETSYGYSLIGGETRDPDQLYQRIMLAVEKLKKDGITSEQFERHRRKILGGYIMRFDSLEFIANNFLAYRFRGTDLFEVPVLLQEIKREELLDVIVQNLDPARHVVSLILPRTED